MKGEQPRLPRGRFRFGALCVLCWVFMIVPSGIGAETVELRFQASTADPALEDLLYFALGIELSHSGFSSTRAPSGSLLLLTDYASSETSVRFRLTLSRVNENTGVLASVEAEVLLNDAFEAEVGEVVRGLFQQAPATLSGAPEQGVAIDGVFPQPLPPPPPAPLPTTVSGFVETWLGGLGLFGRLAEVAQYGVGVGLGGGLAWLDDAWSLRVATRATTTRALTNPGVIGGALYLSAVSVGADWGTGRGLPVQLMAGGSLGVLVVTVAGDRLKSKSVPWVDGVARLGLPLAFGFSVGAELRFQVAFETNLILGLSPALSLGKEL